MRSLIIIEVEHGDDTDPVNDLITELQNNGEPYYLSEDGESYRLQVADYTVRIDLPPCFKLDS